MLANMKPWRKKRLDRSLCNRISAISNKRLNHDKSYVGLDFFFTKILCAKKLDRLFVS